VLGRLDDLADDADALNTRIQAYSTTLPLDAEPARPPPRPVEQLLPDRDPDDDRLDRSPPKKSASWNDTAHESLHARCTAVDTVVLHASLGPINAMNR